MKLNVKYKATYYELLSQVEIFLKDKKEFIDQRVEEAYNAVQEDPENKWTRESYEDYLRQQEMAELILEKLQEL